MQVKALKTFNGRLGLIRAGMVITVDQRYGGQLIKNRLAVEHIPNANEPESALQPGPQSNTDLGGPQHTKGDEGNAQDDDQDDSSEEEEEEGEETEDESEEEETEEETEDEPSSQRGQASGATAALRADQQGGGRGRQSSSRRAGRRSRKKT